MSRARTNGEVAGPESKTAPSSVERGAPARARSQERQQPPATGGELARVLRRRAVGGAEPSRTAPSIVRAVLATPGRPLEHELQRSFERAFGRDVSHVRVHDDAAAARSARAVDASGYAVGRHVVLGDGADASVLAHEVAHVLQQDGAPAPGQEAPLEVGDRAAPAEREAERAADAVAGRRRVQPLRPDSGSVLRRQPPQPRPQQPPVASPRTRPTLNELITIANTSINGEYASAARDGLSDFEAIVGNGFDFGPFLVSLAGNILWALACFYTGGIAFTISMEGIALGAAAPAAASTSAGFHLEAGRLIDEIVRRLLDRVTRAAQNTNAYAAEHDLDDAATRSNLLGQFFSDEYIHYATGGEPTVDRGAVRHRFAVELLERANRSGGFFSGPGRFVYWYDVSGHTESHGFWPFDWTELKPPSSWTLTLSRAGAYVPSGGADAVRELQRDPAILPASIAWEKNVRIGGGGNWLEIVLDASNAISSVDVSGVFEHLGEQPQHPRGAPVPPDREGAARQVLANAWSRTSGTPPPIRGSDLQSEIFPGWGHATR